MTKTPSPLRCRLRTLSLPTSGLCFAGLVIASAPARADAADADPPPAPATLESVTVTGKRTDGYAARETAAATKLALTPRETPQSVTVVTREQLDDQQLTSLRSVLDHTAGIYSSAYDSERVVFFSRGFPLDTLMVDGVPSIANFNTQSIDETGDTALYDRIEIVRGATGLMTGAGNPAASVNLVRKRADAKSLTASVELSLGSWRSQRAEIDVGTPLNADASVRGRVVAVAEDDRSYQALYHKKKYVGSAVVDADVSAATRVSVGFDVQENRPKSNTWGSFPLFLSDGTFADWPRSVTTSTDWAYWNKKTQTLHGEVRHAFDNGWSLLASLSRRRFEEDYELFYVAGAPDPVTGEGLVPYAYKSRDNVTETALDVYASGPFDLFGRRHEAVLGYNGSRARNVGTEYSHGDLASTGNFFRWDGSYPRPDFSAVGTPSSNIRTDQDGLYAAGRFAVADRTKLIAGGRFARWAVDSFYVYDSPTNSKYDFHKFIPYAGLVRDVLPQVSAFVSYTGIFKPQSSRDVDGHYLPPIQGRSIEFGLKGEHFDQQLNTSLTVFQTRQTNVAAPVTDAATGSAVLLPDGSAASQPIDSVRTRGFEFEATGRLDRDWQGTLGWTRYLMQDGNGAAVRTYVPGTLVRGFATWEPSRWLDGLRLGAGVNWQSATSTTVSAPSGPTTQRQGSVLQLALMARLQVSPKVSVQLNANNVTDRKFYVLDEYGNSYYGAPANYTVALRVAY